MTETIIEQAVDVHPDATSVAVTALISANDDIGLTIRGVKAGDTLSLVNAAGICSFAETDLDLILGVLGIVAQIGGEVAAVAGAGPAGAIAFDSIQGALSSAKQDIASKYGPIHGKMRDAYGADPHNNRFAADEGGVIFCMPSARGAKYAGGHHFSGEVHGKGRIPETYSPALREGGVWFPCRMEGGLMAKAAIEDGDINILAFDSNFKDNHGVYQLDLILTRQGHGAQFELLRSFAFDQQ